MSKRSDGRQFELWIRDYLRSEEGGGWDAEAVPMKALKIKGRLILVGADLFGADVIAIHPGRPTLFVQGTLDSGTGKRLEEFKRHKWDHDHQRVQLWQKKANGEVCVLTFNGTEFVEMGRIIRRKFYALGRA